MRGQEKQSVRRGVTESGQVTLNGLPVFHLDRKTPVTPDQLRKAATVIPAADGSAYYLDTRSRHARRRAVKLGRKSRA